MTATDSLYYFHQQPDSVSLLSLDEALPPCLKDSPWAHLCDNFTVQHGIDPTALPYNLAADDGAVVSLLLLFVLGVILFVRSWYYMRHAASEFFFPRGHNNIYDAATPDSVLHGGLTLFLFISLAAALTLYVIGGGTMLQFYDALDTPFPLPSLPRVVMLPLCIIATMLALFLKIIVLQMVNSTFFTDQARAVWREGIRLVNLLTGTALWAVCIAATFFQLSPHHIIWAAVLVIVVAKLLILIKTQSAFFPKVSHLSRLILYFCTLELSPALFIIAFFTHQ